MIRALIVDDEIHSRDELEALLDETGMFSVVGKCDNAIDALKAIKYQKPEVVFLDIQMPGITGMELLSMIDEEIMPIVVFVTAYDEYALKAFEESAFDYLLKPVEKQRLAKTATKIQRRLSEKRSNEFIASEITRIPCVGPNRIKLINVSDVEYVRSDVTGVYLVCGQGKFFTELTLNVLEVRAGLLRCHKQFLVNINHVDEIILHDNQAAIIKTLSGKSVPVSRRRLKKIRQRLEI
ncbi:MAG: two-component system response regulator BtsR [Desulfomonilaceae bacterium]